MSFYHFPVLVDEVLQSLSVQKGKKYIDATVGGGGHGFEIVKRGGKVLGIDVDEEALNYVQERIKNQESRIKDSENLTLARGNFRDIDSIARSQGFEKVSGILFDLGISTHQISKRGRGFSFQIDETLDMRMDKTLGVSAKDLVNALGKTELTRLFLEYGEERGAKKIAERIVQERRGKELVTTFDLAKIVEGALKTKSNQNNPKSRAEANMRVFQALRIAVNDELASLSIALPRAVELLESGGRLSVISFHSLEDRIVKRSFQKFKENNLGKIITKKPIVPTDEEIERNRSSRSAKLRVFERF